jgi:hypothetical protein
MSQARSSILASFAVVLGCAAAACGGATPADSVPAAGGPAVPLRAVASVDQLMDAIIIPSSQHVFDAVVYVNGQLEQSPKSDDDWFRIQMSALAVAEAGNLLMLPPRAKDGGEWLTFSRALTDSAYRVAQAAEAKNLDLVLQTGGEMYNACTACHEKYLTMPEP